MCQRPSVLVFDREQARIRPQNFIPRAYAALIEAIYDAGFHHDVVYAVFAHECRGDPDVAFWRQSRGEFHNGRLTNDFLKTIPRCKSWTEQAEKELPEAASADERQLPVILRALLAWLRDELPESLLIKHDEFVLAARAQLLRATE